MAFKLSTRKTFIEKNYSVDTKNNFIVFNTRHENIIKDLIHKNDSISIRRTGNSGHKLTRRTGNSGHRLIRQWFQQGGNIRQDINDINSISTLVSMNGDGTRIAISFPAIGKVKVYELSRRNWNQIGDDLNETNCNEIEINGDGTKIVIKVGNEGNEGIFKTYEWDGSNWSQMGEIIVGQLEGDYLVSMSYDGSTIIFGDPGKLFRGIPLGGVRVYTWNGSEWINSTNINGTRDSSTGTSVSISDDGSTFIFGNPGREGTETAGNCIVYYWNGENFIQKGDPLTNQDTYRFGEVVSINSDGSRVAIGSPSSYDQSGIVRVYDWDGSGWVQLGEDHELRGMGTINGFDYERYGSCISLSSDGNRIAICVPRPISSIGRHIIIYDWNGTIWTMQQVINTKLIGDKMSMSMNSEGTSIIVSMPDNDSVNHGVVKVYTDPNSL